jgi:peroxiredoxin
MPTARKAPDFLLSASTGEQIRLSDLKGKFVVLIFYPANDTPVCNLQLGEANLALSEFAAAKALVLGVNPAPVAKTEAFCKRQGLQFPILSDPGGKVAKQYNAHYKWFPFNVRTVVIVDPQGNICYCQRGKPHPEEIIAAIKRVRLISKPFNN